MKLRLRFKKTTKVLTVDDEEKDSFTVKSLATATQHLFGEEILKDFSLSLNNVDVLEDETKPLSTYNIVSGDLVYVLSQTEPQDVIPPQPQKPVLLNSASSSEIQNRIEGNEDSQQSAKYVTSHHRNQPTSSSNDETYQEVAMETGQSMTAAADEYSGRETACIEADTEPVDPRIVNQCLSEPILCREASYGCVPSLLKEQFDAAQPSDVQEAVCVVLHVLMVETGFIHVQPSEVRRLPEVWRHDGYFKLSYQYPACEDITCSLTILATGPLVIVHGRVQSSQGASRQCQLRTREYIRAVTQDCLECYHQLPKLSRVFKDNIANPLVQDIRTGLEDIFGLLALTQEVKLRILNYLDVRSLCKMAQVNSEMSSLCSDPYLWRCLYLRHFGNRRDNSLSQNWRQMYKQEHRRKREHRKHMARILSPPTWGPVGPFGGPSNLLPPVPGGIIGGDYDLYPNFQGNLPGIPGRFGPTPMGLPRPRYDLIGPGPYMDPNAAPGLFPRRPRGGGASGSARFYPRSGFGPRFF